MKNVSNEPAERFRQSMNFPGAARLLGVLLEEETSTEDLPDIEGYVLDSMLGEGGGGEVYQASRGDSNEQLAVKVLRRSAASGSNDRAWRELDVLSELKLPGVPRVLDYGVANGRLFFVTPLVQGHTLIEHCAKNNLGIKQRVELLIAIARLVQGLHEHGVIHRDIKPANIIIQPDGTPVIIDFGIAALLDNSNAKTLTKVGDPIGTIGFMSPEQARGERENLSTRSDVYGLGAIACLLLTQKTPHDVNRELHEAVRRVAQDPPRHPLSLNPSLPKPLAEIIARAVASRPHDRYASATLFADDLHRWLNSEPIPWQKTLWLTRLMLAWRRNPKQFMARAAVWLLVALVFVTSSVAVAQFSAAKEQRSNAEEAIRLRDEALALIERQRDWEKEARSRDAWYQDMAKLEGDRVELRERQMARMRAMIANGQIFDATVVLLGFAEDVQFDVQSGKPQTEWLNAFVEHLNVVVEAAMKERGIDQDSYRK